MLDENSDESEIAEACASLQRGGAVIIVDSPDREGEGDLAFAACFATPELVNLSLRIARGLLCVALRPSDTVRLGVSRLPSNNLDKFGTPFGFPISIADESSGISATARARTMRAASDPAVTRDAFCVPGHVATLIARAGGLAERQGHTEAVLDLLGRAGIDGPGVLCEVLDEAGEIAGVESLRQLGEKLGIPLVYIDTLLRAGGG
jgi:3,4-dihydroxy 2-butanone 4-phosphate synthase/GTP cyclohydrolase II